MAERTTRGDEERNREDETGATGQPVGSARRLDGAGNVGTPTTRDKGVKPADDDDARHGDRDENR